MTTETLHAPDEVFNQSVPLADYNLYVADLPLREAVEREGGGWGNERLHDYGAQMGRAEVLQLGELANRHTPILHSFDRAGRQIDEVEFHPAWHELMRLGVEAGVHAMPWVDHRPGSHVVRAALMMLRHQVDEGSSCPLTMTFAVIPSLRLQPDLAAEWEPRALATSYDPRSLPATEKRGVLFGMGMTERQGGSDVRANTTRAEPLGAGGPGAAYRLSGHKWFLSAPMCDAFLVLAQAPGGLSCFLLPRRLPDGSRNPLKILRLKDKAGNRSNASSEVEFAGARARMVGEEGRGVATIIEMVRHTRLDCAIGSAASLRRALAEALHHTSRRAAFGRCLIDQPLMQNVLADLCLESEAATALALRLARSFDEAGGNEDAARFSRLATAIGKYWITRRAIGVVAEALECLGGNGYIEDWPLARLYRDIPLNSIWEGSGNVHCLDALRAVRKDPATLEAVLAEIRVARGGNRQLDRFLGRLERELADPANLELRARRLTEQLALGLQAALLVQHAPDFIADSFCAARLGGDAGLAYGTLPGKVDVRAIIERNRPLAR